MTYLNQIIDFTSVAYNCSAEFPPVNTGIGTNFHIVPYDNISYVWNLREALFTWTVTKAIGSDTYIGMKNTVLANDTSFPDYSS